MDELPVKAKCPRCGYDVGGAIPTWTDRCPLSGVCPECGFEALWRDVLTPGWSTPRWLVESRIDRPRLVMKLVRTFFAALVPWRFWRTIRVSHELRPGRLAACLVLLLAAFHGARVMGALQLILVGHARSMRLSYYSGFEVATYLRADVPTMVHTLANPYLAWARLPRRGGGTVLVQIGSMQFWIGWVVALCMIGLMCVMTVSLARARVRHMHLLRIGVLSICGLVAIPLVVHLSQVGVASALMGLGGWATLGPEFDRAFDMLFDEFLSSGLVLAAQITWLFVWWWAALRLYVRMPHAAAVSLVMLFTSGLASMVLIVLVQWFMFVGHWPLWL